MAELTHLNEASVVHNLHMRYQADLIYVSLRIIKDFEAHAYIGDRHTPACFSLPSIHTAYYQSIPTSMSRCTKDAAEKTQNRTSSQWLTVPSETWSKKERIRVSWSRTCLRRFPVTAVPLIAIEGVNLEQVKPRTPRK